MTFGGVKLHLRRPLIANLLDDRSIIIPLTPTPQASSTTGHEAIGSSPIGPPPLDRGTRGRALFGSA
jgi:hypothetical protein